MNELKDLEMQFIVSDNLEEAQVRGLTERILKFCKIDQKGFVRIHEKKLKVADKIMLVLCGRYLANKLQTLVGKTATIKSQAPAHEIEPMVGENHSVVLARLKDLKDENRAMPLGNGVYSVAPHEIDAFLRELEEKGQRQKSE